MKLEDLRNELENKIKDLILKVLKDFNMSNYKIDIYIYSDECEIIIREGKRYIACIKYIENNSPSLDIYIYKDVNDYIFTDIVNIGSFNGIQKDFYSVEWFIQRLDCKPIKIIKELYFYRKQIETELKNILE